MKEVILAVLKKAANRTQVLGDNRMHDLIVDDDFEAVAEELESQFLCLLCKGDKAFTEAGASETQEPLAHHSV